jgi:hypothetical protein
LNERDVCWVVVNVLSVDVDATDPKPLDEAPAAAEAAAAGLSLGFSSRHHKAGVVSSSSIEAKLSSSTSGSKMCLAAAWWFTVA